MITKDYIALAEGFRSTKPTEYGKAKQWMADIKAIAEVLQAGNPHFDIEKFVAATGMYGY